MNIDILSFHRPACRVFEETAREERQILEDPYHHSADERNHIYRHFYCPWNSFNTAVSSYVPPGKGTTLPNLPGRPYLPGRGEKPIICITG